MFFTALRNSKRRQTRKHFVKHRLMVESLEERTLLAGSGLVGAVGTKDDSLTKLDTTLAATLREYQAYAGADTLFEASAPLLRIDDGMVVVDAVASGDVGSLQRDLEALGLAGAASFGRYVSGRLPLQSLDELADVDSLQFARATHRPWSNVGLTDSQGDAAMRADIARSSFGVDGSGVTVGVLSDTFDDFAGIPLTKAADDVASGDLPPGITVLDDTGGPGLDEGRAMLQLIHDVAPGADLAFHTAFNGQADFANGILELASVAGADVIVDDVIYFAEPMFQDGIIAQAVDTVNAAGVAYFSSAGNSARDAYQSEFRSAGTPGLFGGIRHDFDPGAGVDDLMSVTFGPGVTILSFQWAEPYFSVSGSPGSASDLDILLYNPDGSFTGLGGFDFNRLVDGGTGDPIEVFGVFCASFCPAQIGLELFIGPEPDLMKFVWFGSMAVNEYATHSGSIYGHANAAGAEAVGAAFYGDTPEFGTDPPQLEGFSSAGSTPILFEVDGTPTFEVRDKPEIVAPDGTNTTFFFPGVDVEPDGFPNFFGTSAAAPHAAAVAALMLEANTSLSPDDVYAAMEITALDMNTPGFDFDSGFGLVQADSAVEAVLAEFDDLDIKKKTKVKLKKGTAKDEFEVEGKFKFGDGSNGFDPVSEDVYLKFDGFSEFIPAGSFQEKKGGKFEFKGGKGGITKFEIELKKNGEFKIKVKDIELDGIDLKKVDLVVRIGDDFGQALLEFDKKGKFKKQK